MKKAFTYLVLFAFLFNLMGYYFLFEIRKTAIQKEMQTLIRRKIPSVTLLKITDIYTNKDFRRIDKKEFIYKGKLYDIIRESNSGNITFFDCVYDDKENTLIANLRNALHHKQQVSLWDHLIKIAIAEKPMQIIQSQTGELVFGWVPIKLQTPRCPVWSPPPKLS